MPRRRLRLMSTVFAATLAGAAAASAQTAAPAQARHNVVLFVADGLRQGMVTPQTAPTMAALAAQGVRFANTHSMFPTFTTANASSMATGHGLGDSGDFSNTIYTGHATPSAAGSVTPFLENDAVLGEVDADFAGNYLNEETILAAARQAGLSTAAIGKVGPVLIFDHTERTGQVTVTVDDTTGAAGGIPLSDEMKSRLGSAGLPVAAPSRGDNGKSGSNTTPGTTVANLAQQNWFTDVATKAALPMFKARSKPFVMVFWSRDPDGTQHNQGDSLNRLIPGINGPTSLAAIRNADADLARLLAALKEQGLDGSTDVIVTADHGFSTISKESVTSSTVGKTYAGTNAGQLPVGFVAIDLARGLGMKLFDPDKKNVEVGEADLPSKGNGIIGTDPAAPQVVIAANGGSDLIYLPTGDKALAAKVVGILSAQDYTSGVFVDPKLGAIPGTLPLTAINLDGKARTPMPAIALNFRSFTTGCANVTTCGVEVADTGLQQGQGMHGSFSRADTAINAGAIGPDFRRGFVDTAPMSNADVGMTIAHVLGLKIPAKGKLIGRPLTEATVGGAAVPAARTGMLRGKPDDLGHETVVRYQQLGTSFYFDAAGYPGRTLGLGEGDITEAMK